MIRTPGAAAVPEKNKFVKMLASSLLPFTFFLLPLEYFSALAFLFYASRLPSAARRVPLRFRVDYHGKIS
jgi:hypothetical protein